MDAIRSRGVPPLTGFLKALVTGFCAYCDAARKAHFMPVRNRRFLGIQ